MYLSITSYFFFIIIFKYYQNDKFTYFFVVAKLNYPSHTSGIHTISRTSSGSDGDG